MAGPTTGTVFKITRSGTADDAAQLCRAIERRQADPYAGLVQATNGNFYGTTRFGGTNNRGTVFKITPSGKLTTLYSFCSQSDCPDGATPMRGWSRPAMETSTGQRTEAGPTDGRDGLQDHP